MLCKKPFQNFSCGQCNPCRIQRRKLWAHRIMLESLKHGDNSFLTLTYDDDHKPADGSLNPKHTQDWLKRFRKALSRDYGISLRYFLVGEYGDSTQRPHYHAALFGIPVSLEDMVRETWGMGHVMLGPLEIGSAQYIAGYVVKKMTNKDDPRLLGRLPEFSRMSLKPGIGATAMEDVAGILNSYHGWDEIHATGDVPVVLQHGGRKYPLGRYLRKKLREQMDFETTGGQERASLLKAEKDYFEMQALLDRALGYSTYASKSPYAIINEIRKTRAMEEQTRILQLETRSKLRNAHRSL